MPPLSLWKRQCSRAGHARINARGESCQHLPEGKASSPVESRTACGKGGRILMPQGTPRIYSWEDVSSDAMICRPLMPSESCDARNTAGGPRISASSSFPNASSGALCGNIPPLTKPPGVSTLAVITVPSNYFAMIMVSVSTAARVVENGAKPLIASSSPLTSTSTIFPLPCPMNVGINACVTAK